MIRPRHGAEQYPRTLDHFCNILYSQSGAFLSRQNRVSTVLNTSEQAQSANIHLLLARFHKAAARVQVVVRKLLFKLTDTESVGNKLARIDANLVLLGRSTEGRYVDDVR